MNPRHLRHPQRPRLTAPGASPARPRGWRTLLASGLLVPATLLAQVASPAPAAPDKSAPPVPVVAQDKEPETLELSPFVVTTEQNRGYQAASTLAGTRLNTDLKDVGAAVSVYTQEFLQDINVSKIEDILTYTASTEGGGQNGNYSGVSGESSAEVRDDPSSVNRVRALAQATRTRGFFASDIPSDAYNFDTVTVSRGPNAILAGVGNAGGIIDTSMRKANFKNAYSVSSRVSSYGSHREEAHFNTVLIPKKLAVRVDLLNDQQQYRQNPAYADDQRFYAALNYQVFEPKRGSFLGRGTLRGNVETGKIDGVPPDPITPTFTIPNWFNAITPKWQWNGALQQLQNSAGAPVTGTAAQTGIFQGFPLFAQWALVYADPNSGLPGVGFTDPTLNTIQGFEGTIPAASAGGPGGGLRGTGDPARSGGKPGYLRQHLIDPQIFNFYDNLLTGVFDHRQQTFNATDLRYEQLLLGGKAGFEAAYNYQTFTRRRDLPVPGSGDDEGIFVDVNSVLSIRSASFPNGIPNPNFGRPFITSPDVLRETWNSTNRESYQLTAFYNHDFTAAGSKWLKYLGRHTLSALFFKTDIGRDTRTYNSTWDPAGQLNPIGALGPNATAGAFGAQVNGWFYLGPSLASVNSLQDVRLQPITAQRPQYGSSYVIRTFDNTTKTFITGIATPQRILNKLVKQKESLDSTAFALQSKWLKDYVTTLVGWREDRDEGFTSNTPNRLANGNLDEANIVYQPAVTQTKSSWTKSVVGRLPVKLPLGTEVRVFWNQSGNFAPGGQRRNIYNEEVGSPTASTEEYGVSISAINNKVFLRVNRYETDIENDAVSGVRNAYAYINTTINNMVAANASNLNPALYGFTVNGVSPYTNFEQVARALFDAIPKRLRIGSEYNFNPRFQGTGSGLSWIPDTVTGLVSVSNTKSKGTEFEAIVNPTKGWRIAFSVAKNEAVKADIARDDLAFANEWVANVRAKDNGALINGQRNPVQSATLGTFLAQYDAEHVTFLRVSAAQSGVSTAEIRKWRANLVTRYDFQGGLLRGVNIGGALRWQDKVGIGYPNISPTPTTAYVPDIANPIYGPSETTVDLSAGYKRNFKLRGRPIVWTLGVNVRNLNAKDEVIPIASNPDGSYATFRIPPERTWTVSNSFAF